MSNKSEPAHIQRLARTVEQEVGQAEALTDKSDEHLIRAGQAMLEARERIKAGALGPDVRWESWARQNIDISDSWRRELIRIAEADDPKAALEAGRAAGRERAQRYRDRARRARQPVETEHARQLLHDYVEGASIETVRRILAKEFHEIGASTELVNRRPPRAIRPQNLAEAA
jgi:hypothetical protein